MIESHVSRDFNGSAADDKKIEIHTEQLIPSSNGCPEMYTLSKDNKLCYFIAKTYVKGVTIGLRGGGYKFYHKKYSKENLFM